MKNTFKLAVASIGLLAAFSAQAYNIDDAQTGANSYWGSNAHNKGDVIGAAVPFDIKGADITRINNILTIKIATNFAGQAGVLPNLTPGNKGIGYGDLFLSSAWNPYGTDAHHASDNASNGTNWTYGLNLDNRWSNVGGTFTLFALNGTNAQDTLLSDTFLSSGTFRNGQEVAVNTASNTVVNTNITGTWSVVSGTSLTFSLNVAGTALSHYSDIAMHWGETCQNDVIEGVTHVPEPVSMSLFALGLAGLAASRRRRKN